MEHSVLGFSGDYDLGSVRSDFPILSRSVHGHPLVYFDNASSAQKPRCVLDAVRRSYDHDYSNVHRGLHSLSNVSTAHFEEAREKVRLFLNAGCVDEIIFTRNATEAINLVSSCYGGVHFSSGDEVVLSILEHHSNIVPWHFHRERSGVILKWVPCFDDGTLDIDAYIRLLDGRVKLVALTQMSNAFGVIPPLSEMISLAHSRGIPVLVDGSQGAVHLDVDVRALDCDFYVFTGHKTYGPSGIGVLYGKHDILSGLPPYQGGGEMIVDVYEDSVSYAGLPHRFEAGTPSFVQAIGLGYGLEYILSLGRDVIRDHELGLLSYATDRLLEIKGLRIFGDCADKGSIISFMLDGVHPHDISTYIDRYGVAVRAGTHCAQPLLTRFGLTATCRASFGLYNSYDEIDHFVKVLEKARKFFS